MATINDLINLKGRRAMITGATGGLGKVMADTLAELGADLVLVDRPGSDFETLAATLIEKWGVNVFATTVPPTGVIVIEVGAVNEVTYISHLLFK